MANILVVDDEPLVLNAMERALRLNGHKVRTAGTAEEAIEQAGEHTFDVIILDYIMPSMSGIAILNQVRIEQPTIRSIIVSGKIDVQRSEAEIADELRNSIEADDYLHKPLANARLLEAVNGLLKKETRGWAEIARRNVEAKKTVKHVKRVEQALGKPRRRKKQ